MQEERNLQSSLGEEALRTDGTPENRGVGEGGGGRASEAVGLVRRAEVRDVPEHPGLDAKDDKARNNSGNSLHSEHCARRDLHVVSELEITGEHDSLVGDEVSVGLEDDDGDGLAWDHVSSDELDDDVERDLLVGDGLDDADGDDEEGGEDERDDVGPDRELRREAGDGADAEDEGDHEEGAVPPMWDLGVDGHEARVDVLLVLESATALAHEVATVPDCKEAVSNRTHNINQAATYGRCGRRRQ
jgi:hypothetical protein